MAAPIDKDEWEVIELRFSVESVMSNWKVEIRDKGTSFDLGDFSCGWESGNLICAPKSRLSSVAGALRQLNPRLRDWEAELDIEGMPIRFRFDGATLHDLSGTATKQSLTASEVGFAGELATVHISTEIPLPTGRYRSNPNVDFLRARWLSPASEYNEIPASSAYALITLVESTYGGRKVAARKLNIHPDVLKHAGKLSAASDRARGRKIHDGSKGITGLGTAQEEWLRRFVKKVGKRMALLESGGNPQQLLEVSDI